jgi:hypothetical protein
VKMAKPLERSSSSSPLPPLEQMVLEAHVDVGAENTSHFFSFDLERNTVYQSSGRICQADYSEANMTSGARMTVCRPFSRFVGVCSGKFCRLLLVAPDAGLPRFLALAGHGNVHTRAVDGAKTASISISG